MKKQYLILMLSVLLLAACGRSQDADPTVAPVAEVGTESQGTAVPENVVPPAETAVPTAIPPTPTPDEPRAATVNGAPIYLADYEQELSRYEQAQVQLGGSPDADYRAVVLDALIERELIAQAATEAGVVVTEEMVAAKLEELRVAAGESGNFEAWLAANQWTEAEFRQELAAEMVTEEMVAVVTAEVPFAVEQVRARYIQVDDAALATDLLTQLQNGADFALLAEQHSLDRVTGANGGDLGFFARGSLLVPQVEDVAFSLQPGELSNVIEAPSLDGAATVYYLVSVIERDPQRPLPPEQRYRLLQQAFESWLADLRTSAVIERLVDTGG